MASPRVSQSSVSKSVSVDLTEVQRQRTIANKQKAKEKLNKKKTDTKDQQNHVVCCPCSSAEESGHMVECEGCLCWSHNKCVGVPPSSASGYLFICPFCIKSTFLKIKSIHHDIQSLQDHLSSLS